MRLSYQIEEKDEYQTVQDVLKNQFHISNRLFSKLKKNPCIFCNRQLAKPKDSVQTNDLIEVLIDFEEESDNIVPTFMDLSILYEDDSFLIVNKSAGVTVHPSFSHYTDSLSNGVKNYFEAKGIKKKIRPVNRLDKNTSGIVIFAKNEYVQECLVYQMKNKTFQKEYIALCEGIFQEKTGTITGKIARKANSIIEREINPDGEEAITHYSVLNENPDFSTVHFILETGRTHQIRVHCQSIGHPILGDDLYGKPSPLISRQALHAYRVRFEHPILKKSLYFEAPIPEDMNRLIYENNFNLT